MLVKIVGIKDIVEMMDQMDVMGKDLVNIVDLKAIAVEKKTQVGGIKQMDVMEPSVEKVDTNALQSLVIFFYHLSVHNYLIFKLDI